MSLGTLYHRSTGREIAPVGIIKVLNLDIKISQPDEYYEKNFPLKRVPVFLSADGKVAIHETIAICYYLCKLKKNHGLLGNNALEESEVMKWISMESEVIPPLVFEVIFPLTGRRPYNKKTVDSNTETVEKFMGVIESYLKNNTYLVGERITCADFFAASVIAKGYLTIWGKDWIKSHPNTTRWFSTIVAQKPLNELLPCPFPFREEPLKYTPPPKEKKPVA